MRGEPLLGNPNCGGIHKTETDAMANPHRENNKEEVRLQGEEGDRVASDEDKATNSDGHPGSHLGHSVRCWIPGVEQVQVDGREIRCFVLIKILSF